MASSALLRSLDSTQVLPPTLSPTLSNKTPPRPFNLQLRPPYKFFGEFSGPRLFAYTWAQVSVPGRTSPPLSSEPTATALLDCC
jgi:hypothetical protein